MRFAALAASIALGLAATAARAQAQTPGWYADFGAGHSSAHGGALPLEAVTPDGTLTSFSYSPLSGGDTMYTARGGLRLAPWLAVEAAYMHLGDHSLQALTLDNPGTVMSFDARARSGGGAVVGILPLEPVDVYARIGFARTQVKGDAVSAGGTAMHVDERFNEAYYGAGVRWNVTRELGVFAEYEKHDKLDLDGYVVGMQWRF